MEPKFSSTLFKKLLLVIRRLVITVNSSIDKRETRILKGIVRDKSKTKEKRVPNILSLSTKGD
jgi:hypothetical protein